MKFNVQVPVKPYVKRFLENNYGHPVDFRNYPRENDLFKRMLKKPVFEKDSMYENELLRHSHVVDVLISEREFYRHGWELSKTDIISFGKYFEHKAKCVMRTVVGMYVSFGKPLNESILMFQDIYHMEEEYWPYDSIKKDFDRYKKVHEINFSKYAFDHIDRMIMLNMSNSGVITQRVVRDHEKRLVTSE
jgi:hypothetical protein